MLKKNCLIYLLLFLMSCDDKQQEEPNAELSNQKNVTINKTIVNSIGETLNTESKKLIEDWPEYILLDEAITDYYSITSDQALLKSKDLSNYTQQVRDSIRIEKLDRPDMKIRLNVLYNTSLRLADMETIKSIAFEEVKTEVDNIVQAFSAVNSKINNIISQEKIEKELVEFEKSRNTLPEKQ